ncbi:28S ribosomal protein S30, mitochondrial [Drosophila grimshawi]|uniref:GH12536 n=1 Tax=Drosophila grimshawi TaxID=7222 RepID=B4JJS3_DROGR|nr:28S ribosomal protein S30, mitochondrial [Drosophila grimshawi]EDV99825.1 GH12536 [Drosophila grimshawi]
MLTLRRGEQLRARLHAVCCRYLTIGKAEPQAAAAPVAESEYSVEPEYPAIRDLTYKARKQQTAAEWHEEIRQLPTVEEKMIKINMPRYYGYKVVDLNDTKVPFNALPLTQHYTRTVLELEEELQPDSSPASKPVGAVDDSQMDLDAIVKVARNDIIEALEYAHDCYKHQLTQLVTPLDAVAGEQQLTQIIVEQINRSALQVLGADFTHLHDVEIDYNPRHEAFWAVGGVDPPNNVIKSKKGREWQKEDANDSVDRLVQYTGEPYLALRHHQQLPPWKSAEESENLTLAMKVPRYKHDARTLGYSTTHQHAVNVPGYWPSTNAANFGLLSFQSRAHLQLRPDSYGQRDQVEALHALAIQSSYAWLLAQANYNGFNTYNELTYPLNTQTVITNGREWSFYEYQLNTLLLHGPHVDANAKVNFCRGTAPQPLYATMSPEGKCVDFNDATLRRLLGVYIKVPSIRRAADELLPYVGGATLRRAADYENGEQREFLERTFKHLASKRPRHLELPEVYMWEKLYKIDNKTRPMEARRRFFERDVNPWRRTLDQHDKEYVPRVVRPGGRKNREGRFKNTYYP